MKLDKHIRYWNKMFSTCQIANWKLFNASLSELKFLFNKVSDSKSSFFGSWQSLKFDFFKETISFCKTNMEYKKKLECFYPCTNVNFCILLAFLRCTFQTESFLKIRLWVETCNVSDSELNDFQRVKFKNTFSKIPRILDWVFYNVPDFELNFSWEINN